MTANWHPTLKEMLDKNLDLAMKAMSLYSQNTPGQTEPRLGGDSLEPIVGRPSDLSETK